ncbi:MAG: hypothetical protein A2268_09790 [Candidatus Raymondbacteria bacterium RifOxyA12_full_50_37]|uniref:peptidoglycan glycosyltransferase n=1 Tax=Candidatus Raymondbacteria bacterium RIFOXYD12_FULL_49_13 TaxID=1817890 RepID=A0A1F7F1G0_UNCRA|nr:MAG: hypothetical protein A2268_09790 [Candidatus Raymondbacteria bacterium RifOxyA12_full_50_37]OGJ93870.1 MAG: hypothetical protein A2248_06505 [Candidatus Raymondbacteria bacterium RIFOXYA2_FULL_49_16]OGJ98261.1 MAG: hypothetical protein A2453_00660 [Candidatus Raymondbacteria bacterium RIFOXYC2_FULL_50_21]OGJ98425.1 MAG: hypothetical protein A2350_14290 [Candidatus Raymondbacteria bacterium RifOxyB12_full_50_8]OGK00494.1 MAG: hypothetical protein A2519_10835 [Candidatus Raymondbacteria b
MPNDKMFKSPESSYFQFNFKPNKNLSLKKTIVFSAIIATSLFALVSIIIVLLFNGIKNELPSISQLENIQPNLITKVYSADNTLLKEFYTERRIWRSLEDMPLHVYNAIIAIEDNRFWYHWGLDVYTVPDILKGVFLKGNIRGGSTLSMQLARNLYSTIGRERTLKRKIKELMTAVQIEKTYTKKDILEFYMNQMYMGAGTYGFQAAAQKYFGKNSLCDITISEAAALAAIVQRPEYFRPDLYQENTEKRKNIVLRAMLNGGYISQAEYENEASSSLVVVELAEKAGKAPYYVEMVRQYLEKKYGAKTLYNSGFSVHTTLNNLYQEKAENICTDWVDSLQISLNNKFIRELELEKRYKMTTMTILEHLDSIVKQCDTLFRNKYSSSEMVQDSTGVMVRKIIRPALHDSLKYRKVQIAFCVLDNKTGAIQSLIGGYNFEKSKFNRVVQAFRQPGSAFKPFIYTAAMDNGYTPASVMLDQAFSIYDPIQGEWRPENYTREFNGPTTLRRALYLSINTIAIKLQQKVGTATVINYAVNMGLNKSHLSPVPSLAIGSCEVIPLKLFSAYSAFANNGVRAEPYFIEDIFDREGNVVETHRPISHTVLDPKTAYIMSSMLRSVITNGTAYAASAKGVTWPAGGKTGTTNEYTDAWFIGFTPIMTCGVWIGIDEKRSLGQGKTGSSAALPAWTEFMLYAYDSLKIPTIDFEKPMGIITQNICKESHMLAKDDCDSTYNEVFVIGTEPDICTIDHRVQRTFDKNNIDPFGIYKRKNEEKPTDEPEGDKKKKGTNIYMM